MPSHPLVFEDYYLQLSSALPQGAKVVGLGEVVASSGLARDPDFTLQTFWNRDVGAYM
jgi:alpha-glucosidase